MRLVSLAGSPDTAGDVNLSIFQIHQRRYGYTWDFFNYLMILLKRDDYKL